MYRLLLFGCLLVALQGSAQSDLARCGYTGKDPWLEAYQRQPHVFPRSEETLYLPVKLHVVGKNDGTEFANIQQVLEAFCQMNEDFKESEIQFYLAGPINLIKNTNFHNAGTITTARLFMQQNKVPNAINAYVINSINVCGFAIRDLGVLMAASCTSAEDHTFAHEVGHYLSLPHTFSGWEGVEQDFNKPAPASVNGIAVERASGRNCETAGDGFCDTPADYLQDRWPCSDEKRSNTVQLDPDSVAFTSDGSLIMSYANDNCVSKFSEEQTQAMRAYTLDKYSSLIRDEPDVEVPSGQDIDLLLPARNSTTAFYDEIQLTWSSLPDADIYLFQLHTNALFANAPIEILTQDTSVFLEDVLQSNKTYYWRVRPLEYEAGFCTEWSDVYRFRTSTITDVQDRALEARVEIFPNPSYGETVTVQVSGLQTASRLDWELLDSFGRRIERGQAGPTPEWRHTLNVGQLPAGIYLLRLQADGRQVTRRLVVQQ